MKKLIALFLFTSFLISCSTNQANQNEAVAEEQTAAVIPVLSIDEFNATAADYVGKEVEIHGLVDHVCKHSGKKLKLVTDGGSVHVDSETRFDDALVGNQINLRGIVRELRVDESYCLQMEEDNIKSHNAGERMKEEYDSQTSMIQSYRDSMAVAGVDHLSFYTIDFLALDNN